MEEEIEKAEKISIDDWPKTDKLRIMGAAHLASGARALMVEVKGLDFTREADIKTTRKYLMTIEERCKAEGYAGYIFIEAKDKPVG
jgi:hypothetical protein